MRNRGSNSCAQARHRGANFQRISLAGEAAVREAFLDYALANGMLSTAMTAKEIDRLAEVVEGAFRSIRPALHAAENNRKVG